jgi:uncharacterized alpha-E superfamily protein
MLSRVAESMFWMGRYVERAENVARFIDVNCNLILDTTVRQETQWQALVDTTGDREAFNKIYDAATSANVIKFLTFERTNLNSIFCCVRAARENARTVRDVISSEMWEQINTFYLSMNEQTAELRAVEAPYEFFNQVKMSAYLVMGVTDSTLSHGEGWNFFRLGRYIERTDKTSRILDVKYYMLNNPVPNAAQSQDDIQWGAVLKSASALEMYRKKHRRIQPASVVDFLIFDTEFPRSILFCLNTGREALGAITRGSKDDAAVSVEALMHSICAEVSNATVNSILISGLHEYLDELQDKLNQVGSGVHKAFFGSRTNTAAEPMPQD